MDKVPRRIDMSYSFVKFHFRLCCSAYSVQKRREGENSKVLLPCRIIWYAPWASRPLTLRTDMHPTTFTTWTRSTNWANTRSQRCMVGQEAAKRHLPIAVTPLATRTKSDRAVPEFKKTFASAWAFERETIALMPETLTLSFLSVLSLPGINCKPSLQYIPFTCALCLAFKKCRSLTTNYICIAVECGAQ